MKRSLLILTLLFSIGAYADTVTSAGSLWYANAGPTASIITNLDGSAFWDNRSYDGFACNVGYFLVGTNSGCGSTLAVHPGNLQFLGGATAGVNANAMTFTSSGGDTLNVRLAITAFNGGTFKCNPGGNSNCGSDVFGYIDGSGTHALFTVGVSPLNTNVPFAPIGSFVYYLTNGIGTTFRTDTTPKQFALFSQVPAAPSGTPSVITHYWLGVEDLTGPKVFPTPCPFPTPTCTDYDYNDTIVELVSSPPPPSGACPATKGFWKNEKKHPFTSAPIFPYSIGGISYTAADFLTVLQADASGGNAVIILGSQLVAAILNIAAGATADANVLANIAEAKLLLTGINMTTGFVQASTPLGAQMVAIGGVLDSFNSDVFNNHCVEGTGLHF
jgi:hypothetical protein